MMTLCKLMQLDFKGKLDFTPEEAYDEYDLKKGIIYAEGWMQLGKTHDLIGDFSLQEFPKDELKKEYDVYIEG